MPKKLPRRLWINVRYKIAHSPSRDTIVRRLRESVENGTYDLPQSYNVWIEWRNKPDEPMKHDRWKRALSDSRDNPHFGSAGFDKAVLEFLGRK